MSRGRCRSLDRTQRRQQQKQNIYSAYPSGIYTQYAPRYTPSAPDLYPRNYGGAGEDRSFEYLEDIDEPPFYEATANSSFDEVMRVMVTPPPAAPTAAEKLDAFRTEVAEAIRFDDLRRRMAAHIGLPADQQVSPAKIDDVRKRITAAIADRPKKSPLYTYKIPRLPEDPYAIPPPPKNKNDVVAIIRRAHAIARLKALEEAKATAQVPKTTAKKNVRNAAKYRKPLRHVPTFSKLKATAAATKSPKKDTLQRTGAVPKKKTKAPQHPPDYVPEEWAAAILRARKLAGLGATNPKLVPKSEAALPPSIAPPPLTFANIMERVSAIRARANEAKAILADREKTPTPQDELDELDEFEALEELYGAKVAEQRSPIEERISNLQNRISALQQQLFQTPPSAEPMSDELDEFEALEKLYGAAPGDEQNISQSPNKQRPVYEIPAILRYQDLVGSHESMAAAAAEYGSMQKAQIIRTPRVPSVGAAPKRSRSPAAASSETRSKFDDVVLENIEMPDFNIQDVPEFAFSAEALADAGFEIGRDVSLADISMPEFDEDVSLDEQGLENITPPDLSELSISGDELALEPDYTLESSSEELIDEVGKEVPQQPGFLTAMVNAVVGGFRNMFSPSTTEEAQNQEKVNELNLDISLPNMFETASPSKPKTPSKVETDRQNEKKRLTPKGLVEIPPHPKNPKDYKAMIKRAQAIQKKKTEESMAEPVAPPKKEQKKKREIKSTIPKRAPSPHSKKKVPAQKKNKKVYPPGEYSPSDAKAVARARSLAGLKNVSALLNPEREAKIAELRAVREAKRAEIEALPPVERMQMKMRSMRKRMGGLPRPSIEALATLEAIRSSLPKPKKPRWRPTARLKTERRLKKSDRVFTRDFGRVLIPTEKTQKTKGWKELHVMSPIAEDKQLEEEDLIQFSPLRPHEGQLRLRYLKERAARRAKKVKERQAEMESAPQYSPIRLQSPISPRTEEIRREKTVTKMGPHGGTETIREEVIEISTIENGEVHTNTRQITTKTDEYGNVTRQVQKGKGLSGEKEIVAEYLENVEPPEFLDTSYIPPPKDPSIPSPEEIINRIRSKVKEKLSNALPNIPKSPRSPSPASPGFIELPQDLTDEELYNIEPPEFEPTPEIRKLSQVEKDQPPRVPTPKTSPHPKRTAQRSSSPKQKSPEKNFDIPPHPKDPKDYQTMIKRARAIHKLKKQEELAAKTALPRQPSKNERVPKDTKKRPRKIFGLKKRILKVSPKNIEQQKNGELPSEPPPLPQKYLEAVARARLLQGLKNRTAALNPEYAAKKAAEQAARAAFDELPEVEKIKRRMEKVRQISAKRSRLEPSAEILGTLAAIRANMPPLEEQLRQASLSIQELAVSNKIKSPTTAIGAHSSPRSLRSRSRTTSPLPVGDTSLAEFEFMEQYMAAMSPTPEVDDNASLQLPDIPYTSPDQVQRTSHRSPETLPTNLSLEEFEKLEAELEADLSLEEFEALEAKLYDYDTPTRGVRHSGSQLTRRFPTSPRTKRSDPGTHLNQLLSRTTPKRDAQPDSIYYDLIQDFRIPDENIVLETSQLMPETPPRNIQERYQRLKEAQKKQTIPPEYSEEFDESAATPTAGFSPIRLLSPDSNVSPVPEEQHQEASISLPEDDWLINIEQSPKRKTVKQFRDLEDIPFDELEYEVEPNLTDISIEKPLSPPPQPADIITRIRSAVHQELRRRATPSYPVSLKMIDMPKDLPDEELLELSAPSFPKTPQSPQTKHKSPRISLPMAWGEVRPATPAPTIPSMKKPTTPPPQKDIRERTSTPKDPQVIPPHPKDPKDYVAMIKRAKAIYKLKRQKEAEEGARDPAQENFKKSTERGRVPISRWVRPPPRKTSAKPRKKVILKKRSQKDVIKKTVSPEEQEGEYPVEPPPLPQKYREAIARARLLRGLKNRTAALNPKIATKEAAKEAAAAAYNALPKLEKIKVHMEHLRKNPHRRRGIRPTMQQIAYLQALKQIGEYRVPSPSPSPRSPSLPRSQHPTKITPRLDSRQIDDIEARELAELAEFEALEQLDSAPVFPSTSGQEVALEDVSLAEFQALDMNKLISDLQQQLNTPQKLDPRERYRQLIAQRKTPTTPVISPVKTPEIKYSPVRLPSSSSKKEPKKRAEKSTTQITRSGNNVIKEKVSETSELVDGNLKQITTYVTTTTDPAGNITCQINESKHVSARDLSAELDSAEDLREIEEPSFLDTTPSTPMERPRPRDIIDRLRKQVKEGYGPEVPTGHLVELRTPPRMLSLPKEVPKEELLDLSFPPFQQTPPRSPARSPTRSPVKSPDISIPELFKATPSPVLSVSGLRRQTPSPEGPIVIPPHPKDPKDFQTMVRRARKIQQLKQNEAAIHAAKEAKMDAANPKKKERVPISKWIAPPPTKPGKRKKLVMKKRGDITATKADRMDNAKFPEEPLQRPEQFAKEVALARKLAGLRSRPAVLPPTIASKESTKRSPIRDYATVLSKINDIKEKGGVVHGRPSLAASAYLDALKYAMEQQQQPVTESPKTRYKRILAAQKVLPPTIHTSPIRTPSYVDIHYSPVRFVSPRIGESEINIAEFTQQYQFDQGAYESLNELEELSAFDQPSYMDVSQYQLDEDEYMPLSPPQTPPPSPSAIISRIRQQHQQQRATVAPHGSASTPVALSFPEELPEEELFELSAPSFVQSPVQIQTPIKSPNITIPYYFEESPHSAKEMTPKSVATRISNSPAEAMTKSSSLLGVYPGLKVKTPKGPMRIPPHPKDPKDVAAIIRRAQIIQKLQTNKAAETAAAANASKVRVPISKRVLANRSAKARRLAGVKIKSNTEADGKQLSRTEAADMVTPTPSYASIMERYAVLKTSKKITQKGPTARQLAHRQHLINRRQRQERKRLLDQLKRLREQQGYEFEPTRTSTPPRQRLEAIKSRIGVETPISAYPYSPVKTPEVIDMPQYQPIVLPQTPPYQYLENVAIPDIEDISMQFDDLDNYTIDSETVDSNLEFEMAEAAYAAYPRFDENIANTELENRDNFNMAERIEMLQQQLLESPKRVNADVVEEEYNMAERIEMLQQQLLESPTSVNADVVEEYNMEKRLEMLENELLQSQRQQKSPVRETSDADLFRDVSDFGDDDGQYDRQNIYDDLMDDFEAIERDYM